MNPDLFLFEIVYLRPSLFAVVFLFLFDVGQWITKLAKLETT